MAQSVGTPGGESETQLLQPRSAQFLAGEETSGLRMKVLRANVKLKVFTTLGRKTWVTFSLALCLTQLLAELNAGKAAFYCTVKSSQTYGTITLLAGEEVSSILR